MNTNVTSMPRRGPLTMMEDVRHNKVSAHEQGVGFRQATCRPEFDKVSFIFTLESFVMVELVFGSSDIAARWIVASFQTDVDKDALICGVASNALSTYVIKMLSCIVADRLIYVLKVHTSVTSFPATCPVIWFALWI